MDFQLIIMNAAGKKLEAVQNLGYNCMKKRKGLQRNVDKFLILNFVEALLFTLLSKCLEVSMMLHLWLSCKYCSCCLKFAASLCHICKHWGTKEKMVIAIYYVLILNLNLGYWNLKVTLIL